MYLIPRKLCLAKKRKFTESQNGLGEVDPEDHAVLTLPALGRNIINWTKLLRGPSSWP